MTLSLCMIVKDEEQTLARCLDCVKEIADEIIIVDTGSSDNTVSIAKNYTNKIYFFKWCDDFSSARNFSFSKATCEFVMWLDADDVITKDNAEEIVKLKGKDNFDVAFLKYAVAFDGEKPTFVYYRERIIRRSLNLLWQGEVHEAITPTGRIIYSSACIYHKKVKKNPACRNLEIYRSKIRRGETLDERQKFYYGRELYFNGYYLESVGVLEDFLKGGGWVENKIEACKTLYYALMHLKRESEAEKAILYALSLSYPRAEECCILANIFKTKGEYDSAIYWYERAIMSKESAQNGGFVNLDYLGFIPAIQLCVIYDKLGNLEEANRFNEIAGSFKPNDKSYLYNKQYFKNKLPRGD
ncbi:MAG: glycosyltransferase [Candidatus Coproplasma sp.]